MSPQVRLALLIFGLAPSSSPLCVETHKQTGQGLGFVQPYLRLENSIQGSITSSAPTRQYDGRSGCLTSHVQSLTTCDSASSLCYRPFLSQGLIEYKHDS